MMISRRLLLLGAPALVVAPAAALSASPLVEVSAEERARVAWAEFAAAMHDISAGWHGWQVDGGKRGADPDFRHISLIRLDRERNAEWHEFLYL